jgi:hypothetical protein
MLNCEFYFSVACIFVLALASSSQGDAIVLAGGPAAGEHARTWGRGGACTTGRGFSKERGGCGEQVSTASAAERQQDWRSEGIVPMVRWCQWLQVGMSISSMM